MINLNFECYKNKLKESLDQFIFYSPYLFPFIISFIFFDKHSLCNDMYFDADTAEIPQQIGTIFTYYDIVKHPVFYSLSFFLYRIISFLFHFFQRLIYLNLY